tara:strand:+ start:126 stop:431 length:306 start_codon:yes stop_codon:yes gene_type:complete
MRKGQSKLHELQNRKDKDGICSKCDRHLFLTVDHIIPVHILENLGLFTEQYDDVENFELICQYCNRRKGNKLDLLDERVFPLLEKYVEKSKKIYTLTKHNN